MARGRLDTEIVTRAAADLVDADGPAALTLARLAVTLQVATPSLYKHVTGLDDLKARVATLSIRRLADVATAAALGRSEREALLALGEAYRGFATAHAGLYAMIQAAPDAASADQRMEIERALGVFHAVIAGYGIADRLSVHAIRLVRSCLHGFADIEANGGFQMPEDRDDSFFILLDALHIALVGLSRSEDRRSGGTRVYG